MSDKKKPFSVFKERKMSLIAFCCLRLCPVFHRFPFKELSHFIHLHLLLGSVKDGMLSRLCRNSVHALVMLEGCPVFVISFLWPVFDVVVSV